MIKKDWLVWLLFFLMAGIGTYFIFQQIFFKEAMPVESNNGGTSDEIKEDIEEKTVDGETGTNNENDGSEDEETEDPEIEVKEEEIVPDEEVQGIVTGIFEGILGTFRDLGQEYNWNNRSNPADFDILKPALLEYASESFTTRHLKELASQYYCECDAPLIPYPSMDVRFTLRDISGGKIVASSIEFSNELHGDNGGTIYFTIIKEHGKWVMDNWKHVSPEKEDMQVTWEEYSAYLGANDSVTFLNEINHNGEKVYVYFDPNFMGLSAVSASSTNSIYEIPVEWIPEEYRKPPYYIKILEGTWNHETYSGGLEISNAYMNIFDFRINVVSSGGHVGELDGLAFIEENQAIFNESEYGCQLTFEFADSNIVVTENAGCTAWHGMNVSFEGIYRREE